MNIIFLKIFGDLSWLAMHGPCMANYTLVHFVHMKNDGRQKNQSKCQKRTMQSKKTLNNHLIK